MTDFSALNSATKYPSIPTYHALDPRDGSLLEEAMPFTGDVLLTEKIDGTNGRIVIRPDGDWLIGSREELLYARDDRIVNPGLSIVPALLPLAERLGDHWPGPDGVSYVFFLEVYGHRIGPAGKQYASIGETGCRLFDEAYFSDEVLDWPAEKISGWRQRGGLSFLSERDLEATAAWEKIKLTPRLGTVAAADLPASIEGMAEFLTARLPRSLAMLDDAARGIAEGIVARTPDRSVIAKAKIADYARTLRRRKS